MFRSTYTLTVTTEGGLLTLRASGSYALKRSLNMIGTVRDCADRSGVARVLLETTAVADPIPDLDRATLGEEAARRWRGLKVAILHRTESPSDAAAVVATNRGATVRVFSSVVEAMAWLTAGAAAPPPS